MAHQEENMSSRLPFAMGHPYMLSIWLLLSDYNYKVGNGKPGVSDHRGTCGVMDW